MIPCRLLSPLGTVAAGCYVACMGPSLRVGSQGGQGSEKPHSSGVGPAPDPGPPSSSCLAHLTVPHGADPTLLSPRISPNQVSAFSTWEKELHKIVFDPRYLLLNSEERRQVRRCWGTGAGVWGRGLSSSMWVSGLIQGCGCKWVGAGVWAGDGGGSVQNTGPTRRGP